MNADDLLLDSVEHSVMENWEKVTIEFERIGLPSRGGWKISYRMHSMYEDKDKGGTLYSTGGGTTLRAALENALVNRTMKRLAI
jgi:hypothetical protein